MIKLIILARRKPGISFEEFDRYWSETHGAVIRGVPEFNRHIRRYVQSHRILEASSGFPSGVSDYDGVAELWFDDVEAMNRAFAEPRYLEVVRADELKFADIENCRLLVVHEQEQHRDPSFQPASR